MEKKIEAYSLVDFCGLIQEAAKEGFEIDFKDNMSIPVGFSGYYRCIMYKGGKTAALLKPPADKESFDTDLKVIEQKFVDFDEQIKQASAEPFTPSIVFEVKEPEAPKKAGRPKVSRV